MSEPKPKPTRLVRPGEAHDSRGVPIYPGDLLKSYHFTDRHRRKYYLYHVAMLEGEYITMVPYKYIDTTIKDDGGRCRLTRAIAAGTEVISGSGPKPYLDFNDRPKVKKGNVDE